MLAIPVDTSSQAPYRSFPCRHEKSLTSLLLLFPKSLTTFREPCIAGHFFLCSRLLPYLSLPAEKKILCFSTSVLDMISSFDFKHTKKPPHGITNGRGISLLSKIAMLCNGFEIQNPCCIHQPKKAAYFRRRSVPFHWLTSNRIAYVIFNLQISQSCRELKNSLTGILEYHSGDMAVKI